MTKIFEALSPYGYVHHRALNDPESFRDSLKFVNRYPEIPQVLEGDLCWNFEDGHQDLYFRHPNFFFDSLDSIEIDERFAKGQLVRLEDISEVDNKNAFFVIELKIGRGSTEKAIEKTIDFMQGRFDARYWIDGFSYSLLQKVREIDPTITLSLHTEFLHKGKVLISAAEWPALHWWPISKLEGLDAIAIRRHFSMHYMRSGCLDVINSGHKLILSRLHNFEQYELSKQMGATAGYVKMRLDDVVLYESNKTSDKLSAFPAHDYK